METLHANVGTLDPLGQVFTGSYGCYRSLNPPPHDARALQGVIAQAYYGTRRNHGTRQRK